MKPQLPILALALLFPISSHAADQAAQTRAQYAAVEKTVPLATVIKRELQGYSAEGGELTAYFQKGVPLKMVAIHFGERGRSIDELYFWNGRLFFVLQTTERYQDGIGDGGGPDKLISRQQDRFYFTNGEMWRWIKGKGEIPKNSVEFRIEEKSQLMLARELLAGARGKAKIIEGR